MKIILQRADIDKAILDSLAKKGIDVTLNTTVEMVKKQNEGIVATINLNAKVSTDTEEVTKEDNIEDDTKKSLFGADSQE